MPGKKKKISKKRKRRQTPFRRKKSLKKSGPIPPRPIILAIDLGTQLGWCLWGKKYCSSGVIQLPSGDPDRYVSLRRRLYEILRLEKDHDRIYVAGVVYEEVKGAYRGASTAIVLGGLRAILQLWCWDNQFACDSVTATQLKKWATGNGRADKNAMLAEARRRHKKRTVLNHNEADALLLAEYAWTQGEIRTKDGVKIND